MRVRGLPYPVMGMGSPLSLARTKGVGGDPVLAAFADGTDGFYFDFSKTDQTFSLYNSPATVPAVNAGDSIGLALEGHAWGGKTLAGQIAANNPALNDDFSSSSGWTLQTDLAITGGKLTCTAASLTRACYKAVSLASGVLYRVTFDIDSVSGGNVAVELCSDANGTNGTGVTTSTTSGTKTQFIFATGAQTGIRLRFQSGTTAQVDNLRIDAVAGNHALQSTTSFQPKRQTGGLARFDGSDDCLSTPLQLGVAGSMVVKFNKAVGHSSQVIMGQRADANTDAIFVVQTTTGFLIGNFGTGANMIGARNLAGLDVVVAMTWDGATVNLYESGALIATQAQSGALSPANVILGSARTDSLFAAVDIKKALAIKKALTAAQIAAITNLWGTS